MPLTCNLQYVYIMLQILTPGNEHGAINSRGTNIKAIKFSDTYVHVTLAVYDFINSDKWTLAFLQGKIYVTRGLLPNTLSSVISSSKRILTSLLIQLSLLS